MIRVLAAVALALASSVVWSDAQFRGGPARQGATATEAPRQLGGVLWRVATGDRVVSSPVYADGTVYFGSDDGKIYAADARSGQLRWTWATDGPVPSTPAVHAGRLFVLSYDGRLHALDAATGLPQWTFATGGERRFEARGLHGNRPRTQTFADPFDVYLSSPAVAQGLVVFGSSDGHVYALEETSGALRWKQRTGDVVHASPAIADGRVVVGSWDSRLYAFDLHTGEERWRFQAGTDPLMFNQQGFQSSPAIVDGVVYVGCRDSHLYAVDLASGQVRWRFSTGNSWVVGSPAVAGGHVVFATSDSSKLHVVEAASGRPVHELQTPAYMFSSPTVAGGVVVTGLLNGSVLAHDLASGRELWSFRTEAARANRGWVLDAQGRLNSRWVYPSPWREALAVGFERQASVGSFFSTALVVDGTVFIGSADGWLYALR